VVPVVLLLFNTNPSTSGTRRVTLVQHEPLH
jgi:hypothetical protein